MFRVDPKETRDENLRSPMKFAVENNNDEIVEILREAIGGEIPDDVKILQLSKAMDQNNHNKFSELLSSLSPELVRSCTYHTPFGQIFIIGEQHRSHELWKRATRRCLLLQMGLHPTYAGTWVGSLNIFVQPENVLYRVDPTVGSDTKEKTSVEMAMEKTEYQKIPLLNLFAEVIELPAQMRIIHLKLMIQHGCSGFEIFKKQLEPLSVEEVKKVT